MPDSTLFNLEVSVTPGSIPGPPLPQLLRRRPSPPINTSQPTERPLTSTSNPAPQKTTTGRTATAAAPRTTKTDPSPSVLSGDAVVTMPGGETSGVGGGEVRPWVGKVNITMGDAGCGVLKGLWWLALVAILGCIIIAAIHAWKQT